MDAARPEGHEKRSRAFGPQPPLKRVHLDPETEREHDDDARASVAIALALMDSGSAVDHEDGAARVLGGLATPVSGVFNRQCHPRQVSGTVRSSAVPTPIIAAAAAAAAASLYATRFGHTLADRVVAWHFGGLARVWPGRDWEWLVGVRATPHTRSTDVDGVHTEMTLFGDMEIAHVVVRSSLEGAADFARHPVVIPNGVAFAHTHCRTVMDGKGRRLVDVRSGWWRAGRQHGHGVRTVYCAPDGAPLALPFTYRGGFRDGLEHGVGSAHYADGSLFMGRFRFGRRVGDGALVMPDGFQIVGRWDADVSR